MSGVTGLVDTMVADKLSLRPDLVRLPSASVVAGAGPALPVEPITNDVRVLSDAARDRQLFTGHSPAAPTPAAAPSAGQELSATAREISTILAGLPASAGPTTGVCALVLDQASAHPAALARSLAEAVARSGLFYESHLGAFAAGQFDLSALMQEPQVAISAHTGSESAAPAGDAASNGSSPIPLHAGGSASGAAVAPPQLRAVVAQQLDLLATGIFQWRGEVWPGIALEWSVQQDRPGQMGNAPENNTPGWSTSFSLLLPHLGEVSFRVSLSGASMRAGVSASAVASAPLRQSAGELQQRLAAAGLDLPQLAVSARSEP